MASRTDRSHTIQCDGCCCGRSTDSCLPRTNPPLLPSSAPLILDDAPGPMRIQSYRVHASMEKFLHGVAAAVICSRIRKTIDTPSSLHGGSMQHFSGWNWRAARAAAASRGARSEGRWRMLLRAAPTSSAHTPRSSADPPASSSEVTRALTSGPIPRAHRAPERGQPRGTSEEIEKSSL
eukprot:5341053-Pyramimonas_sp.AAC.1